jgi:hypothetical protein
MQDDGCSPVRNRPVTGVRPARSSWRRDRTLRIGRGTRRARPGGRARALAGGTSGTGLRRCGCGLWPHPDDGGIRRDELPIDARRRCPVGIRWSLPASGPSAAGHLQGPVMTMTALQYGPPPSSGGTEGTTPQRRLHGSWRGRLRGRRGWPPRPPAGRVRGPRARSSVGERCLHTAEVRGSIPRAPTGTSPQVRAGPPPTSGTGPGPCRALRNSRRAAGERSDVHGRRSGPRAAASRRTGPRRVVGLWTGPGSDGHTQMTEAVADQDRGTGERRACRVAEGS